MYDRLKKINPDIPTPMQWNQWDFYEPYCSEEQFLAVINDIHQNQDHDDHIPYPEAGNFLETLKERDYYIIIASHRSPVFTVQTERWLQKHGLLYDDLHLSHHKTELFDMSTAVVVDDSPQVLEKAVENGSLATGLSFPWNRAFSGNGFRLCDNLNGVLDCILNRE